MHEASITRALLDLAQQQAPPGTRIRWLRVSIGRLTCVSPEAMQFYFEVLREETVGHQAELQVVLPPLKVRCTSCEASFEASERPWLCPTCGAPTLVFSNGDELDLLALEVDDGATDHDRTEDPQEER